jgi:hypothetical protein
MLALALAVGAYRRAGDAARAKELLTEVNAFAVHNQAPGLLRLAGPTATSALADPVHAA